MPPRHRFLEPIHNVKEGQQPHASAAEAAKIWSSSLEKLVERIGIEPMTSSLQS
jgi:hypothetical protein